MSEGIVLFDGVCNLCNSSVQFIINHDPDSKIKFASLQSEAGQALLKDYLLSQKEFHSIILIRKGKIYQRSDAVLQIVREFKPPWSWIYSIGRLVPRFIRDAIYQLIATNRYKIFGRRTECMIPTPDLKRRFL